ETLALVPAGWGIIRRVGNHPDADGVRRFGRSRRRTGTEVDGEKQPAENQCQKYQYGNRKQSEVGKK
ncbi:hypothetical protein COS18_02890, partial [Candidatus Falkowbacteria bacterium CG02_land_8_20_14_3_00_36_14]